MVFFLNIIILVFVFLYKNHSPRAAAWQVQEAGWSTWGRGAKLFVKALDNRCDDKRTEHRCVVYRNKKEKKRKQIKLYSPCTPLLLSDHLAPSSLDAPFWFYWVKLRTYLLCTAWVLTHLQNKKKWFPNLILSWPIFSLDSITFPHFSSKRVLRLNSTQWRVLTTRWQQLPVFFF